MKPLIGALVFLIIVSCGSQKSIDTMQGISGSVFLLKGDFMPGPGKDLDSKMQPVSKTLQIYSLLLIPDNAQGPFYQIDKKPLEYVISDESGYFFVKLPTGKYSILVKEDKGLFANMTDGTYINPIEVYKDSVSNITIRIDHQAFY